MGDVIEVNEAESKALALLPAEGTLMSLVGKLACAPDFDPAKFLPLLAAAERERSYLAEQAFNAAMTEAQTAIRPIAADASNPQTRSKYASYLALDKALRPIYTQHGFALSFDTGESAPDMVKVLCYVSHKDGYSRTYKADMPADGKGAKGGDVMTKTHATGAAITYGQRYLLKMIFNIAVGLDDDGNSAAVTDADFEELFRLIRLSNVNQDKLWERYGVSGAPELSKKQFGEVMDGLRRMAGTKGAAAPGYLK